LIRIPVSYIIILGLFTVFLSVAGYFFYGDDIDVPFSEQPKKNETEDWWSNIPVISQITEFFGWVISGFGMLIWFTTFDFGENLPWFIKIFIVAPIYLFISMVILVVATNIIEAIRG